MFDRIIKNGTLIDGSGADGFQADVGIRNGSITALGSLPAEAAGAVIDASGMVVTPGFVDIHRHGDLAVLRPGFGELELRQGLTTVVNGNCGMSAAPFGPAHREETLRYLRPVIGADAGVPTDSVEAYLTAVEAARPPIHVGLLAGSGVLRADAAGFTDGALTPEQLRTVRRGMERALADGALGISLGLGYAPDCFYSTDALIEALSPLRGTDVPLTAHIRDEGSNLVRSVEELITVARALGCPTELSHFKAIGRANWGVLVPQALDRLRRARAEGLRIGWDVYPYTAGSTQLLHVLPPEVLRGGTEEICRRLRDPGCRSALKARLADGDDYNNIARLMGWENILISSLTLPEHRAYIGKSVAELAAHQGRDPADLVFDLLAAENCAVTMIDFITDEADIEAILRSEAVSLISDSTYPTEGRPHPRLYGTFVRLIERYIRQRRTLTLPQAVRRMTEAPAKALGLKGKGRIAVGFDADLNIFDPAALHETGTYAEPSCFPTGMHTVLVLGEPALQNGRLCPTKNGTVLRGNF